MHKELSGKKNRTSTVSLTLGLNTGFPLCLQVHSYLPSNKGTDSVHSVPGQADHCWGLDSNMCLLHAVVFPSEYSGTVYYTFLILRMTLYVTNN